MGESFGGRRFGQARRIEEEFVGRAHNNKKRAEKKRQREEQGSPQKNDEQGDIRTYRSPDVAVSRTHESDTKLNGLDISQQILPSLAREHLDEDMGPTHIGTRRDVQEQEGLDAGFYPPGRETEDFYRAKKLQAEKRNRKKRLK